MDTLDNNLTPIAHPPISAKVPYEFNTADNQTLRCYQAQLEQVFFKRSAFHIVTMYNQFGRDTTYSVSNLIFPSATKDPADNSDVSSSSPELPLPC